MPSFLTWWLLTQIFIHQYIFHPCWGFCPISLLVFLRSHDSLYVAKGNPLVWHRIKVVANHYMQKHAWIQSSRFHATVVEQLMSKVKVSHQVRKRSWHVQSGRTVYQGIGLDGFQSHVTVVEQLMCQGIGLDGVQWAMAIHTTPSVLK